MSARLRETMSGEPMTTVSCDGIGCSIRIHVVWRDPSKEPDLSKAERILQPDWLGRHYCPACQVRRGPGIAERPCPDPEHR